MKIPRRGLLKGSAVLAATMLLPNRARLHAATPGMGPSPEVEHAEATLVSYLSGKGYRQITPAPFVTGDDSFNGGLRYDDSGIAETPGTFFIQPCARTSDIADRHRKDVLPIFHILRFDGKPGEDRSDAFMLLMGCLEGSLHLDPARLAFVSIPSFKGLRPQVAKTGMTWDRQVIIREPGDALNAGDGSGFFRHPGDKAAPAIPTAGLYYWVGAGGPKPLTTYPLPATWTEIGELFIAEKGLASFGLGIERLAYAATGKMPTWNAQLSRLHAQIDRASAPGAPPSGKAMFMER
jgi:hypothetical protein